MTLEDKYPATLVLHLPSGPTPVCYRHAEHATTILASICFHVVASVMEGTGHCECCVLAAKGREAEKGTAGTSTEGVV